MMTPKTEEDLAQVVAGAKGALRISGGGTRGYGRPVVGEVLSAAKLTGVTLYDPGALTMVARAGTPLAEVEAALKAENQRLAFEPMDHRPLLGSKGKPTIGGAVAANISGPRRISVGACRDFLLGVRFVDGVGQIVKNGGRVMKNVTGYDLVKLMAGAHGTLGVLTEVSFKVMPDVEKAATLTLDGLDDARAVAAMSRALGSPFDVTGAAHLPGGLNGPRTYLRIEGFAGSVGYRAGNLAELLVYFGTATVTQNADAWTDLRDVTALAARSGDIWRISVKPSDAAGLVANLDATAVQYDWGGGLIWALAPAGTDLRAPMDGISGHATLIRADEATRAAIPSFHPEPAPLAAITQGLRAKFDPRGILNPGLMH